MNIKILTTISFLSVMPLLLLACSSSEESVVNNEEKSIAATVNGHPIFHMDINFFMDKKIDTPFNVKNERSIKKEVLNSLIAMNAMMQKIKAELPKEEVDQLSMAVSMYEREIFARAYLEKYAVPDPVSNDEVADYYQSNLEKFGRSERKEFEVIALLNTATESDRDSFIEASQRIKQLSDWGSLADDEKFKVSYKKATYHSGLYAENIEMILNKLQVEESSNILLIDNIPTLFRVTKIDVIPARPLHEVSNDIRQQLAPVNLKKAIKQASKDVVSQANVEIFE